LRRKAAIPSKNVLRLLNTGATVLVSSGQGRKRSVLAVAWQMPASIDPPLVVVSIGRQRYSHVVMKRARAFVINIPTESELPLVRTSGTVSGWETDKFEGHGITPEPAATLAVPRVAECPAHVECRLVRTHRCGDHTLFVGEVTGAFAISGFMGTRLRIGGRAKMLHHMGGEVFHLPGPRVRM